MPIPRRFIENPKSPEGEGEGEWEGASKAKRFTKIIVSTQGLGA